TVKTENLNDLWTLYNIIAKNDKISARTYRRVVLKEGSKGERKPMSLKLKVESAAFHEFSNRLRVKGTIIEGPEDFVTYGTYHTFNIEPNQKLTINKEKWLKSEIKRLKESSSFETDFIMLIIAIETGLATISLITNFSHKRINTISLKDLDEIFRLESNTFKKDAFFKNSILNLIINNTFFFKLINDDNSNEIVGFIIVIQDQEYRVNLINLLISKQYQNKGYGSHLLKYTLNKIKEMNNIEVIVLNVNSKNKVAIRLYQKFGFQIVQKIENYYRQMKSAYLMILKI
ncbi:unnamed protein product, partial [marine sediment metagenome]